ncbi:MAG: DUF5819 family protein [Bacteroidia bacterium]
MKIFRFILIALFGLFLIIHVLFTLVYTLPENIIYSSIKQKASIYINPLFNQGWALFAPTPQVNKKVYVSYLQDDNKWSVWQNPFKKYLAKHQLHRFTANGKIVLMQSNTLHYLYFENEELFKTKNVVEGDTTSGFYNVLKYEVTQELLKEKKSSKKIKLLVQYTDAKCENKQTHYIYYSN